MRSKSMGSVALSLLTLVIAALLALSAGSALSSSSDHRASGVAPADVGETLLPASHVGPGAGYVPPSVGETTVLINNTVYPGLFRSVDTYDDGGPFSWGTTPAYDPNTNLFYEPVSNVTESATSVYYGGYLAAISPVTDRLVQLIPVGLEPEGVVFDSSNGLLYVVNHDPGNISIVNPSTNATIGSLALPANSYTDGSIAVNSSSGHLFLVSPANGIYDVNIASNTSSVISSVAGGTYVVYDNQTGELYQVGNSIQVIGASNDTLWKTINFPSASPNTGAPAVDWKTDELYVPWGKNTSAVNLTTNTLGPTLSFNEVEGATPAAAFDPDNGMVYVISDYSSYNVTELNPATHQWVGSSPQIPSTRVRRHRGVMRGVVSTREMDVDKLVAMAKPTPTIDGLDLAKEVSTKESYSWTKGDVEERIIRCLTARGSFRCSPRSRRRSAKGRSASRWSPTTTGSSTTFCGGW